MSLFSNSEMIIKNVRSWFCVIYHFAESNILSGLAGRHWSTKSRDNLVAERESARSVDDVIGGHWLRSIESKIWRTFSTCLLFTDHARYGDRESLFQFSSTAGHLTRHIQGYERNFVTIRLAQHRQHSKCSRFVVWLHRNNKYDIAIGHVCVCV